MDDQQGRARLATGVFPSAWPIPPRRSIYLRACAKTSSASGGAAIDSLNQPGDLRPGAVALLNASTKDQTVPVVAWQRYGKGQVLGIATNTMWKWAAAGDPNARSYGRFWRQAVRGLTKKLEGGSLLGISWNQDHYRPGEQAVVEVQVRSEEEQAESGSSARSAARAVTRMSRLRRWSGRRMSIRRKFRWRSAATTPSGFRPTRGRISRRVMSARCRSQPLIEEGASPELKDAYLRTIAAKARGVYTSEADLAPVETFLRRAGRVAAVGPYLAAGQFQEYPRVGDHCAADRGMVFPAAAEFDMKRLLFCGLRRADAGVGRAGSRR